MAWSLALLALALLGVAAVSQRLSGTPITPTILFVAFGLLVGPEVLDGIDLSSSSAAVRALAETTLALVLFSDASRIDLGALGGFNRPSQHSMNGRLRWERRGGGRRIGRGGRRCVRRGVRRWGGWSIVSGSGWRSRAGCPARTRPWRPGCQGRLASGGFVRVAGCRRSRW